MSFWSDALPYAEESHAATGVLTSVILAQWADEQGYRWPPEGNNPGNVGSFDGQPIHTFGTLAEGVAAYIQTMKLGYYDTVRLPGTYMAQAYALGDSPWASGHYHAGGGPPGEDLIKIIQANTLTQYDTGPVPTPTPPPIQEDDVKFIITNTGGTVWLVGSGWKVGIPSEADVASWLAAGAIEVQLSEAQVNMIPTLQP